MEKPSAAPASAGPRQVYRKADPGETALRSPKKPRMACNAPDMPTSVRSLFANETVESSSGGKTTITHIQAGFNFLGQNVRKYKNKLVIKPARDGTKALLQKTHECIKGMVGQTAGTLIRKLNPKRVRGEANPYDPRDTEYFEKRRCFAWRTLSPRGKACQSTTTGV